MNVMLAFGLGGWEVVGILAAVLILFGAKKLPELAKGLGTGIKEFKKATREVTDEIHNAGSEVTAPPKAPPANTTAQITVESQPQPPSQPAPPQTKVI